jgi:ubiquinone/menaquinone biosynthesis C-methylase UbiE
MNQTGAMLASSPTDTNDTKSSAADRYVGGYGSQILQGLGQRRLDREGAFFLPHLRPGMRLLDCGCGPGAMTVQLAEIVAPGTVVGVDIEGAQFTHGEALARARGVTNVRFEVASAYALPYPDASFDAVFAHAVLYHLGDPARALAEFARVLVPGGVVGLRDTDRSGDLWTPAEPTVARAWDLAYRVLAHHGGNAHFGRMQGALLAAAGFHRIERSASYDCFTAPTASRSFAATWEHLLLQEHADLIVQQGWADAQELTTLGRALREWGQHPEAFYARARCEAVAWKP